jgi:hypothetical protein
MQILLSMKCFMHDLDLETFTQLLRMIQELCIEYPKMFITFKLWVYLHAYVCESHSMNSEIIGSNYLYFFNSDLWSMKMLYLLYTLETIYIYIYLNFRRMLNFQSIIGMENVWMFWKWELNFEKGIKLLLKCKPLCLSHLKIWLWSRWVLNGSKTPSISSH